MPHSEKTEYAMQERDIESLAKKFGKLMTKKHPEFSGPIKAMYEEIAKGNVEEFTNKFDGFIRNLDFGDIRRIKSFQFARDIGMDLQKVRADGYTTQREIAERFNELGVKSFHKGGWSHNTVKNVIHRRRVLGLE